MAGISESDSTVSMQDLQDGSTTLQKVIYQFQEIISKGNRALLIERIRSHGGLKKLVLHE